MLVLTVYLTCAAAGEAFGTRGYETQAASWAQTFVLTADTKQDCTNDDDGQWTVLDDLPTPTDQKVFAAGGR